MRFRGNYLLSLGDNFLPVCRWELCRPMRHCHMAAHTGLGQAAAMWQYDVLLRENIQLRYIQILFSTETVREQQFLLALLLGRDNGDKHGTQLSGQKGTRPLI